MAVEEYDRAAAFCEGSVNLAVEIYGKLIIIQDSDFDVRIFAVDFVKLPECNSCPNLLPPDEGPLLNQEVRFLGFQQQNDRPLSGIYLDWEDYG